MKGRHAMSEKPTPTDLSFLGFPVRLDAAMPRYSVDLVNPQGHRIRLTLETLQEVRAASAPVTVLQRLRAEIVQREDYGGAVSRRWLLESMDAIVAQESAPASAAPHSIYYVPDDQRIHCVDSPNDQHGYECVLCGHRPGDPEPVVSSPPPSASVDAPIPPSYDRDVECDRCRRAVAEVLCDRCSAPSASGEGERQELRAQISVNHDRMKLRRELTDKLETYAAARDNPLPIQRFETRRQVVESLMALYAGIDSIPGGGFTRQSVEHTCIKDDGGTAMRRCHACEEEKSALASASSGDAGTGAMPSVAQACRCPAPVGVPCPLSESECAGRIKANLASPKAGPA